MEADVKEILSAFVDGEAVEPGALASALMEPGAREALVDFVLLRAALADEPEPSMAFVEHMRRRLGAGRPFVRLPRSLRLVAVAAVLALATLGVLDLGRLVRPARPDSPPTPTRVMRFEPGVDWLRAEGK